MSVPPSRWQVRTAVGLATLGPPAASLVVFVASIWPLRSWQGSPAKIGTLGLFFVLFGVPVGYAIGIVPAAISALLYCGALTALPSARPLPYRALLGSIIGGIITGIWFHFVVGSGTSAWGALAALIGASLSLRWPQR
jgi:hypothetical protein